MRLTELSRRDGDIQEVALIFPAKFLRMISVVSNPPEGREWSEGLTFVEVISGSFQSPHAYVVVKETPEEVWQEYRAEFREEKEIDALCQKLQR